MKRSVLLCRILSAAAVPVLMLGALSPSMAGITAFRADAGQLLGQLDFDEGAGLPWHICESAAGKMDFEIEDGVYRITILDPGGASRGGEDRWDCQFRHRGLKIVSGHQYRVSYEITASNSGKYYTKIGNLEGDIEVWHNMCTGSGDFDSTWDLINIGANETKRVDLTFTAGRSVDVAEWAFHLGGDGQYTQGDCFPAGTVITFDNMSLVDLTSGENDFSAPEPRERRNILVNQAGYIIGRKKQATLVYSGGNVGFDVKDMSGNTVFSGESIPLGYDQDSGDDVHILDFSDLDEEGTYYIETDNGDVSGNISVGGVGVYSDMAFDALNYFYQNRSGIEIKSEYITSGDKNSLARAAGHVSDPAEIQHTWGYSGSSGTLDVRGGWYDAGDHGKYTVNGGLALWLLQNQYETALKFGFEDAYADGTMYLPECADGFPDLLNEARWEMEWMFEMIVEGGEYDGMVYHKAHDESWTGLGVAPADDDKKRIIKPPTTAATLNFAACAAQAARLWRNLDPDFSEKCIAAAEKSFAAAKAHPDMYAPLDESVGGGAYGDDDASDEFYWAACELFITTGDKAYYDELSTYNCFLNLPLSLSGGESVDSVGSFDWGHTSALGNLSLALNSGVLDSNDEKRLKNDIAGTASAYLELENSQGYGLPYAQSTISYNDDDIGYQWGSNSFVSDNSIILAYGYLVSGDTKYLDGAVSGIDYLLGRNPMDISYVTGYGEFFAENPHHRWWSNQIDPAFPKAPSGVLVGGPNSGMEDPWVRGSGWKKGQIPPQKCYLDHIEAWSVNECCINWNASLAWLSSFIAAANGGIIPADTSSHAEAVTADYSPDDTENVTDPPINKTDNRTAVSVTKNDSVKADRKETISAPASENQSDETPSQDSVNNEKNNNVIIVAVIAGASVIVLISAEIFIYQVLKLRSDRKKDEK